VLAAHQLVSKRPQAWKAEDSIASGICDASGERCYTVRRRTLSCFPHSTSIPSTRTGAPQRADLEHLRAVEVATTSRAEFSDAPTAQSRAVGITAEMPVAESEQGSRRIRSRSSGAAIGTAGSPLLQ
jgi:hypothetical protein